MTQLVSFGKAVSVPPKPRLRVIYWFIFQVSAIIWMSLSDK